MVLSQRMRSPLGGSIACRIDARCTSYRGRTCGVGRTVDRHSTAIDGDRIVPTKWGIAAAIEEEVRIASAVRSDEDALVTA